MDMGGNSQIGDGDHGNGAQMDGNRTDHSTHWTRLVVDEHYQLDFDPEFREVAGLNAT